MNTVYTKKRERRNDDFWRIADDPCWNEKTRDDDVLGMWQRLRCCAPARWCVHRARDFMRFVPVRYFQAYIYARRRRRFSSFGVRTCARSAHPSCTYTVITVVTPYAIGWRVFEKHRGKRNIIMQTVQMGEQLSDYTRGERNRKQHTYINYIKIFNTRLLYYNTLVLFWLENKTIRGISYLMVIK